MKDGWWNWKPCDTSDDRIYDTRFSDIFTLDFEYPDNWTLGDKCPHDITLRTNSTPAAAGTARTLQTHEAK